MKEEALLAQFAMPPVFNGLQLTAELKQLETEYDAGHVTREQLDSQLEVLVPRHERQQQEIASALTEIERLRQQIFDETGLDLPPVVW